MVWTKQSNLLATADATAGTSVQMTGTFACNVGEVVIIVVAKDNAATADGNTNEVTSITDNSAAGNVWTKLREFCNSRGAANGGATVSVWYSQITSQIPVTTGTITANFSDSRTASCITGARFSVEPGSSVLQVANATDSSVAASTVASMSISGLPSAEYLFVRGSAIETNTNDAAHNSSGYANFTSAATTGGGASANMCVQAEGGIVTGASSTSAPTWTPTGDNASVMVALREIPALPFTPAATPYNTLLRM